jgi:hypothetical protein
MNLTEACSNVHACSLYIKLCYGISFNIEIIVSEWIHPRKIKVKFYFVMTNWSMFLHLSNLWLVWRAPERRGIICTHPIYSIGKLKSEFETLDSWVKIENGGIVHQCQACNCLLQLKYDIFFQTVLIEEIGSRKTRCGITSHLLLFTGAATCHDLGLCHHSFSTEATIWLGEAIECHRVFRSYLLSNMKSMFSNNGSTI